MPIDRRILHLLVATLLPGLAPPSAVAQDGGRLPGAKSETKALLWSLLGTVVPAGAALLMAPDESSSSNEAGPALLFLGSTLIGPSLGHFYSGRSGRALVGIGVRTVAVAGLVGAAAATWNGSSEAGDALAIVGLAVVGAVLAYDIIRAPHSARAHNKRMQSPQVSIGLTGSTRSPGVRIGARLSF